MHGELCDRVANLFASLPLSHSGTENLKSIFVIEKVNPNCRHISRHIWEKRWRKWDRKIVRNKKQTWKRDIQGSSMKAMNNSVEQNINADIWGRRGEHWGSRICHNYVPRQLRLLSGVDYCIKLYNKIFRYHTSITLSNIKSLSVNFKSTSQNRLESIKVRKAFVQMRKESDC